MNQKMINDYPVNLCAHEFARRCSVSERLTDVSVDGQVDSNSNSAEADLLVFKSPPANGAMVGSYGWG
jgi:hypothetical protein